MGSEDLILVGVDGSEQGAVAVRWAAVRAAATGARLRLVHVVTPLAATPDAAVAGSALPPVVVVPAAGALEAQDRAAREVLRAAEELVREAAPGVPLTAGHLVGGVGAVLVDESAQASLVVLGSRGLGAAGALLLGSVGIHVASRAACPTVVVHGTGRGDGPVVVGIDGPETSRAPASFAVAEAHRLGRPLVAVHSWVPPVPTGVGEAAAAAWTRDDQLLDTARRAVDDVLAPLRERYPDVAVETRLADTDATAALLDLARTAALVVVGSHGRGALAGFVLGSTSQEVLRRADCPVAVVRALPEAAEPTEPA